MTRDGGCQWYQSIGLIFLYISANEKNLKDPGSSNNKKRFSADKQLYATWLNQNTYAAKKHDIGWFYGWIFLDTGSNLFPIENKKIRRRLLSLF